MQKCSGGRKAELFVVWMSAVCSRRCAALLPAQNRREGGARNKAINSFLLLLKYWKPQFFFLALSDHFTLKEKYTKQAGFFLFFLFFFFCPEFVIHQDFVIYSPHRQANGKTSLDVVGSPGEALPGIWAIQFLTNRIVPTHAACWGLCCCHLLPWLWGCLLCSRPWVQQAWRGPAGLVWWAGSKQQSWGFVPQPPEGSSQSAHASAQNRSHW